MFGHGLEAMAPYRAGLLGAPDQLASVERLVRDDPVGRGAPLLAVRNPCGFSFDALLDRALDIGWAQAGRIPLAWKSPRGFVNSARYEPDGFGWGRTFGGGLLSTCGLASTGMPSADDRDGYGLHGRIGHVPVDDVRWDVVSTDGLSASVPASAVDAVANTRGDWLRIVADVVECGVGTPTLRLHRQLFASLGNPVLLIVDEVTNESQSPAAHMYRHHLNLGYPLVADGTRITSDATPFGTRDHGEGGVPGMPWDLDLDRSATRGEEVVYFRNAPTAPGRVRVTSAPVGTCEITFDSAAFPCLIVWRDATVGVNALGIEPSTSRDEGRRAAAEQGDLIWLDGLESRTYWTSVTLRAN